MLTEVPWEKIMSGIKIWIRRYPLEVRHPQVSLLMPELLKGV